MSGAHTAVPDATDRGRPWTRRTSDPDEAQAIVAGMFLPNRVHLPAGATAVDMELTGTRIGTLTAGRLSYGRGLRLVTSEAQNST